MPKTRPPNNVHKAHSRMSARAAAGGTGLMSAVRGDLVACVSRVLVMRRLIESRAFVCVLFLHRRSEHFLCATIKALSCGSEHLYIE